MNSKLKQQTLNNDIFKPKPGWGGKLKKRLPAGNLTSKLLPFIAFSTLAFGIYLFLK